MLVALWVLCAQAHPGMVILPAGHMERGATSMGGAISGGAGLDQSATGSLSGWGRYASADRLEWVGSSSLTIPYNGLRMDGGARWLITDPSPWVNFAVSLDPSLGFSWRDSESWASLLLPVRMGGWVGPAEWWVFPWVEIDLYDPSRLPGLGLQVGAGGKQDQSLRGELGYGYVGGEHIVQIALGISLKTR